MFVNKIVFWLLLFAMPLLNNFLQAGVETAAEETSDLTITRYQISDQEIIAFFQKHALNLNNDWKQLCKYHMTAALFERNIQEAFDRANVTNKHLIGQCDTLYEFLEQYFCPSVDYLSQEGNEEFLEFQDACIAEGLKKMQDDKTLKFWKSKKDLYQAVIEDIQKRICHHLTTHEYYDVVPPFVLVVENLSGEDGLQLCNVHIIGLADTSLCPKFAFKAVISSAFSVFTNIGQFMCSFGATGVASS